MLNLILKVLVLATIYGAIRNRASAYELFDLVSEGAAIAFDDIVSAVYFFLDLASDEEEDDDEEVLLTVPPVEVDESEAFVDDQADDPELADAASVEAEALG
jgi:hypothetical protein